MDTSKFILPYFPVVLLCLAALGGRNPADAATNYITIQGTVINNNAVPYAHVLLKLLPYAEVAVYSSELKVAKAGDIVSATGYYKTKTVFLAASARIVHATPPVAEPTPRAITQRHILTGDYLGGYSGSHAYTWSTYAPWLSLAETNARDSTGIAAAGIRTMAYSNPNRLGIHDPMYTSDESAYAHTCQGSRLVDYLSLMLTEPSSLTIRAKWKSTMANQMSLGHFDYIFMDDANDIYGFNGATPCGYDPRHWLSNSRSLIAGMPFRVIYNGLGILSSNYAVSASVALNDVSAGGMKESCYLQKSGKSNAKLWRSSENTELIMAAQRKMFICYANQATNSAGAHDSRMFAYASFLLTYDPQSSMIWERFASPSGFRVQPETQIVATLPLISSPTDISGLLTSTGVYAREYAACYVGGSLVGPCAAVVNASDSLSHSFPYTTYHHSLTLNGGGVLDGGTMNVRGPAPYRMLAPLGSAIIFR